MFAPKNRPGPKKKALVFQPSFFRFENVVSFREIYLHSSLHPICFFSAKIRSLANGSTFSRSDLIPY